MNLGAALDQQAQHRDLARGEAGRLAGWLTAASVRDLVSEGRGLGEDRFKRQRPSLRPGRRVRSSPQPGQIHRTNSPITG